MNLSCASNWQKRTYGPGIFVNEVTVADAVDVSGTTPPFLQEPVDIGVKLYLDIGRDFQPELLIVGNFKKDVTDGEVIGWGGAFVVQDALAKLGYVGELENNRLPFEAVQSLIGRKFLRLSYVSAKRPNGKLRYSDWNTIATVEEGAESLVAKFRRSLSRGYPKNYRPELLDEVPSTTDAVPQTDDTSF